MGNVNMEAYQVHYRGDESVADHLHAIDNDIEKAAVLPDLPTAEGKTVLTAVTDGQGDTELTYETPEVESEDIAPEFSEDAAYSEGDLVYYEGILYKFSADHAAGTWDPSEVTQTTVAAEFNELKNTLTSVEDALDALKIKKTTVEGTTDSNGIIESNLARASKLVLSAYDVSSIQNLVQVGFNSSGNYIFRFTNNAGVARSDVTLKITVYYLDIASS